MDNIFTPNLFGVEFDPLYSEIEATLAQQDESADPLSMPNEPPKINWPLIAEQSGKLLEQCYDLRVALWLIRADIHQEGIYALFRGLVSLDEQIARNQDSIYPISEESPANSGHAAALGWLSTAQCIAELKSARLTSEHSCSLQELFSAEPITDESNSTQLAISTQLVIINLYFQQNGYPDLLEQFITIAETVKRIEDYANQHSEGYQLDCDQLHIFLAKYITLLSQSASNGNSTDINHMVTSFALPSKTMLNADNTNIRSRQEVILMLDRILEYFKHYEPSHPAPIFIRRTKQMIGMDFISIVEDLLPDSVMTLQQFTGKSSPVI